MLSNKKPLGELKLSIGGIVFSVVSDGHGWVLGSNDDCLNFITGDRADVVLRAYYKQLPEIKGKEQIFDTGTTWSTYQSNGKYVLEVPDKIAVVEPDFKSGNIYIEPQDKEIEIDFPLNYPLAEILMINLLSKGRGVLVHACGVSDCGLGLLFAGTSGAGKSTLCNHWKDKKDVTVLSDDRIIIRKINGRFLIYGTPWHGDAKICSPERIPLKKIFFLKHAEKNKVERIEGTAAASKLLVCSFPTFWDKKGMEFTLGFIDELTREVPCYELDFLPDKRIIDFVRNI